jgi:RNA polymerase sigma factor (sigma-70 family)
MDLSDETIYRKHKDDLIRYATVLVGSADAEDVLSTVVLRTMERRSLGDLDDARAYLFRAILNEARDRARRRSTARALPVLPADPVRLPEPDYEVASALRTLPPRQLAAVYLVYWEDLTIRDAARELGTSSGTVKRYLHLARKKLKGLIEND